MNIGGGGEKDGDFELNLASIIDCFTVLITYLLVSASFITLGSLDVTVASATPSEVDTLPPDLTITIALGDTKQMEISTEGKETNHFTIPVKGGDWDFESMTGYLKSLKDRYPAVDSAMVTADDAVKYSDLVHTVEAARQTLPQVALSAETGG